MKREEVRIGVKVTNANEFESVNGLAHSKSRSSFSYGVVIDDRLVRENTIYRALIAFWRDMPGNTAISIVHFPLCRLKIIEEFPCIMPDEVRYKLLGMVVKQRS